MVRTVVPPSDNAQNQPHPKDQARGTEHPVGPRRRP
jgi:hypothetical protein